MKKTITIFAGNECRKDKEEYYFDLAYQFGMLAAKHGFRLASGGGPGLMDQAMKGAYDFRGDTIGILFQKPGRTYSQYCKTTEIYTEIRQRQEKLISLGDMYVALPGGIGTLYEIIEVLELKKIHVIHQDKPLFLIDPFFRSFQQMIENVVQEAFAPETVLKYIHFVNTPEEVFLKQ